MDHLLDNMESGLAAYHRHSNYSKSEAIMNKVIFSLIKQTFIPVFIQKLQSDQIQAADKVEAIS